MNNTIIQTQTGLSQFYAKVYGFVAMGIGLSAVVSGLMLTVFQQHLINVLVGSPMVLYLIIFGELGLVLFASRAAARNTPMALPLFLIYSAVNGYTLSFVIARYTQTTVLQAFVSAAVMFAVMAVIGLVTKKDLSAVGKFCLAALLGVIIASVVNMFIGSGTMSFIVSLASVLIFAGLIAWDNQQMRLVYEELNGQVPMGWIVSLALNLYLDFINLFIHLLNIFARRD
ncbi:Bax inhibitor-1/YccA family protein [Streptococcus ovuberis]|uniref:Bax inhibitor-1/YccA family protein n=1 Tax=Streptococcus ovuberis TaxID=1936207 RepID=A0A7X6MYK3_9STRE|nr:Bax inhibitor-1/YccA family protein [Streptococcus ovuberis]NKZ19751.1 Bax inhibitor-1/YccA family protein [Streptococcus ovuberis]